MTAEIRTYDGVIPAERRDIARCPERNFSQFFCCFGLADVQIAVRGGKENVVIHKDRCGLAFTDTVLAVG